MPFEKAMLQFCLLNSCIRQYPETRTCNGRQRFGTRALDRVWFSCYLFLFISTDRRVMCPNCFWTGKFREYRKRPELRPSWFFFPNAYLFNADVYPRIFLLSRIRRAEYVFTFTCRLSLRCYCFFFVFYVFFFCFLLRFFAVLKSVFHALRQASPFFHGTRAASAIPLTP
jgi:hypothetical protein